MKQEESFENMSECVSDEDGEFATDSDSESGSDEDDYTDMAGLLSNLLATDDDNVCTAMLKISTQLETTNKLLVKFLAHVTKKD